MATSARTGTWSTASAMAARPIETFEDGVEVDRMVMALYKSAETGQAVRLPDETLETYVPLSRAMNGERLSDGE